MNPSELDVQRPLPDYLMAAIDQSPDAIALFTFESSWVASRILYANPAHLRLSGYTYDQLVGHSSMLLAGARPSPAHARDLTLSADARAEGLATILTTTRKHRPDGSAYDVELSVSVLRDARGEATHRVLTQRDVTERERDREARQVARLMNERMSATARVAAGAAYELEAPVSKILANLRRIESALEAKPATLDVARNLRAAIESAEDVTATVRGLKAFTTPGEDEAEDLDVHEAIELASRIAQREIDARATLVRQYVALPRVRVGLAPLTHVLVDLLRNAAESIPKYSPSANRIVVRTSVTAEEPKRVTVEVTDTGAGIAPDDLPYIFDPFFTTKPRSSARGLGLAAARATVAGLGGTLTVESVVGLGSRFRICLPALPASLERAIPFDVREANPTRCVLCVTPSNGGARVLGDLLEDDETRVTYATSDEALERLALGEQYDLVACELHAATNDGFRARLRRVAPEALNRTFALRAHDERASHAAPAAQAVGDDVHAAAVGSRLPRSRTESVKARKRGG